MPFKLKYMFALVMLCLGIASITRAADNKDNSLTPFLPPMQPGQMRPLPDNKPIPGLDFTILSPHRSPVPRAVDDVSFSVKMITITGATAYPADELDAFIAPVRGQTAHLTDLIAIAESIEAKYRGDGYILTRVYVPTQNVSDGIFNIKVVEGYVASVSLIGGDEVHNKEVKTFLGQVTASRPLQVAVLERALVAAGDLPGITVTGILRPSAFEPGASDLVVTVKPQPISSGFSADNRGSGSSGHWTTGTDVSLPSPYYDGGILLASLSTNPAFPKRRSSGQLKYTVPLLWKGMTLSFAASGSHGEPGGTTAKGVRMISSGATVGPRFSVPLLLERQNRVTLEGGVTVQSSNLDGVARSHDEWRVADLSVSLLNSDPSGRSDSVSIVVAQGIPSLGATGSETPNASRVAGHTDFTKFTAILRHSQPVIGQIGTTIMLQGQFSNLPTVAGEEISFGGSQIGRGYDGGSVTGDKGLGGGLELNYNVDASSIYLDSLQPYIYYDAGKVWVNYGELKHDTIMSIGGGARVGMFSSLNIGVEGGRALLMVPGNDKGKRNSRIAVNASVRF